MDNNNSSSTTNLLSIYKQIRQRIDLEFDFENKKVLGSTKLTFLLTSKDYLDTEREIVLKLNAENVLIKNISIVDNNEQSEQGNSIKSCNVISYQNSNPIYTKMYLDSLYENVEDIDSFMNINRIEWETRQEGNLVLTIKPSQITTCSSMRNKFKIQIDYELIEKYVGICFQSFYDEKIDLGYDICYTPNFYFNTVNWVPCIYNLRLHIHWKLYLIVPANYSAFCSCHIAGIFEDPLQAKKAYYYKSKEPLCAKNVGFIVLNEKVFNRFEDPNNKNILYVVNENKRERVEKNMISNGLISSVYNFYEEFFESEVSMNSNLSSNAFIVFVPYLIINSKCEKHSKYISVKEENYFNMIKFPNLYILPEKLIYNSALPDLMEYQLKNIGKIFLTNYIGGLINESSYCDFWIVCGIENWLSDHFLLKCLGPNWMKCKIHKCLKKLKRTSKSGNDKRPLYTNNFTHPVELQFDDMIYLKSGVVMHLLESQVEKIYVQKALKNIINERHNNGYNISTESFIKIFKKNCGVNLKHFMNLWIFKTGMLELKVKYNYNKRTNSIDVELFQSPVSMKYYEDNPIFKIKDLNYSILDRYNKKLGLVDFRSRPVRYFDVNVNVDIYQTNGIEVMRDSHQIKIESEKDSFYQNFPLIAKIRKAPIKKREQEFIQELISNTSIAKVYNNEEIERILTQTSIMWVRVDPDVTHIRSTVTPQQHIIYDYIKIFKEGDLIGQYESLKNIYADKENYQNSLTILETFIRSGNYYKLRLKALKYYVKIFLKMKNEEGYTFLMFLLDECYNEILKNKTQLNYDSYFILRKIIKYLGNYREDYFNEFFVIGRVTNTSIQNKIIDKFLDIVISNELNIISGFNDAYIMRELMTGCAKLNLQEKVFVLLQRIVKYLRVEKLKRSFNEISIISAVEAFYILFNKNDFFAQISGHSNLKQLVNEILNEINYYINTDCENYELKVYLDYFQLYMIYYKSRNFFEFGRAVKKLILGEYYNNPIKCVNTPIEENENFLSKLNAFSQLMMQINFTYETLTDKIEMVREMKEILHSSKCYNRLDCRILMESVYSKIFFCPIDNLPNLNHYPIHSQINSNYANFLHHLNKNWVNFAGKKYADEEWLYAFAQEERKDRDDVDASVKYPHSEMSSEIQSKFGTRNISLIKRYRNKYPNDTYALMNLNIPVDIDNWQESCENVLDKLINHPLAEAFCMPLNEETLGELFTEYYRLIKRPIDMIEVKGNLKDGAYNSFQDFMKDLHLVFSNCREFNEKGSDLHNAANQLEEFLKILVEPLKK